jgi:hypothetical protein
LCRQSIDFPFRPSSPPQTVSRLHPARFGRPAPASDRWFASPAGCRRSPHPHNHHMDSVFKILPAPERHALPLGRLEVDEGEICMSGAVDELFGQAWFNSIMTTHEFLITNAFPFLFFSFLFFSFLFFSFLRATTHEFHSVIAGLQSLMTVS